MKKGWEYKKLGEICDFRSGFAFKSNKFTKIGEPIIRISDIQNEEIDDSNLVYFDPKSYTEDLSKYLIYPDDILIAMSGGTTGKLGINTSNRTFYLNQRVGVFRENKKYLNHRYLFYYLHTKSEESLKIAAGAAQPNLSTAQIKSFIIPISPLSEQQRIVDYLDSTFAKIDAMKANAEESLNEAKALFQASLKEMLEPKECTKWGTIGDLFETYSGGTPTKSNKEYYEGGSIPWLRSGEVCQKEITETEMFITEKGLKESSAKYYPENTVVVAMYGATAAQVGILRIVSTSNQAVCGILPQKDFLPEFIYYWFSSIEDKLAAQAQGGAQPNISQQKIKKVEIPIYSITEQQSIVVTLDSLKSKVDRLQANFEKISQECDALKQAILKQVFE